MKRNILFSLILLNSVLTMYAQQIPVSGNGYHYYGPNTTWGEYLKVGGNGRETTNASVVSTNGNLHLDSKDGFGTFLNYYSLGNTYLNAQGGVVGIGTTQPQNPLHIRSSINDHQVKLEGANGKHTWIQFYPSGKNVHNWQIGVNTNGFSIYDLAFSYRLTISNKGNIGIGENNPKGILHAKSGSLLYNSINTQYDANIIIEATNSSRTIGQGAALGFVVPANTDGSNPWQQGRILVTPDNTSNYNACGRMYIQTRYLYNGAWHWNNNIVLRSSGNVGIGVDDPKAKLSVNGTIISTEIKVLADINQYPDFVFSDDYFLKPINEVEDYIKKNKHLPDIPKADEVEEGIALGEMNTKLLQKIEELTLYTIEQQKQIDKQMELIQKLAKKIEQIEK